MLPCHATCQGRTCQGSTMSATGPSHAVLQKLRGFSLFFHGFSWFFMVFHCFFMVFSKNWISKNWISKKNPKNWLFRSMSIPIHGYFDPWLFRSMAISIHGYFDPWLLPLMVPFFGSLSLGPSLGPFLRAPWGPGPRVWGEEVARAMGGWH